MPKLVHHLSPETAGALDQRADLGEWTVTAVSDPAALIALCSDDKSLVLLLDSAAVSDEWYEAASKINQSGSLCTTMIVFEKGCAERALAAMSQSVTTHMLPASMVNDGDYLPLTLQKLSQENLFGIEHYITPGLEPTREVLSHTRQKYEQLEVFERFCELSGVAPRIAYAAVTVADELVMNAIYHAPVLEDGACKYGDRPRNEPVSLEFSERVEFRYACDDTRLVLAVTDRFGTLNWDIIQQSLVRCLRGEVNPLDSPGQGAGLGLYSVFSNVSQLIVNIVPGERTEALVLWDITASYKEMLSVPTAINVFTTR